MLWLVYTIYDYFWLFVLHSRFQTRHHLNQIIPAERIMFYVSEVYSSLLNFVYSAWFVSVCVWDVFLQQEGILSFCFLDTWGNSSPAAEKTYQNRGLNHLQTFAIHSKAGVRNHLSDQFWICVQFTWCTCNTTQSGWGFYYYKHLWWNILYCYEPSAPTLQKCLSNLENMQCIYTIHTAHTHRYIYIYIHTWLWYYQSMNLWIYWCVSISTFCIYSWTGLCIDDVLCVASHAGFYDWILRGILWFVASQDSSVSWTSDTAHALSQDFHGTVDLRMLPVSQTYFFSSL